MHYMMSTHFHHTLHLIQPGEGDDEGDHQGAPAGWRRGGGGGDEEAGGEVQVSESAGVQPDDGHGQTLYVLPARLGSQRTAGRHLSGATGHAQTALPHLLWPDLQRRSHVPHAAHLQGTRLSGVTCVPGTLWSGFIIQTSDLLERNSFYLWCKFGPIFQNVDWNLTLWGRPKYIKK